MQSNPLYVWVETELYWICDYLSMLRLELIHVIKSGPWSGRRAVNNNQNNRATLTRSGVTTGLWMQNRRSSRVLEMELSHFLINTYSMKYCLTN